MSTNFIELLEDISGGDPARAAAAFTALENEQYPEIIERLETVAHDPAHVQAAVQALCWLAIRNNDKGPLDALERLSRDKNPAVRGLTRATMAFIGTYTQAKLEAEKSAGSNGRPLGGMRLG